LEQSPKLKSGPADKNSKLSDQLIAYIMSDGSASQLIAELRGFLAAKLPHYMVPAEFVLLDRLPLSPNGKVDYAALPPPTGARATDVVFEEPASELERRLADIFREVLGGARIGRWDDFFRCGGHSLLAAQAAARIRQRLQIDLQLANFLEAPTVAALARHLASPGQPGASGSADREEISI
jgi:hypothetical protein